MAARLRTVLTKGRAAAAAATFAGTTAASVTFMSDDVVHPSPLEWSFGGILSSYDCASLRRGYQVYRQVCATCHSIEGIHYRQLVGVTHSADQLVKMAEEVDVVDGPNDDGEMFERPGKLSDPLPKPYANAETGRMANGGALPPDLTLMAKARHNGPDYLFHLLTGYMEAPAGKPMMAGLYYNPYFPGGAIAMPPPLQEDGVEYEDGTPATISQQAKDVVEFLNWCAEPEADERKKQAFQYLTVLAFTCAVTGYYKRMRWSTLKTRNISYVKSQPALK
mmetsp:Transcript_25162/g.37011  ORF Transcript_25162/g.37011 Transcript_25162/m.37011 type:complete len:278 (+) Transcript_25162:45-878(+)|eukprot:CAMPEP_0195518036 /NCGR_PEP_ID=MMETSP0794_2-20130614/12013_1 /TAXON_ID=515487 /ORGANISM="Stephanopyxis turris, Strain CCMP 815" /LENGTH=277 /DNA_ID=CAMNT_0040646935 /DNA_START=22 /DNA_END=855 /DNA_ORIENTATION=+